MVAGRGKKNVLINHVSISYLRYLNDDNGLKKLNGCKRFCISYRI